MVDLSIDPFGNVCPSSARGKIAMALGDLIKAFLAGCVHQLLTGDTGVVLRTPFSTPVIEASTILVQIRNLRKQTSVRPNVPSASRELSVA